MIDHLRNHIHGFDVLGHAGIAPEECGKAPPPLGTPQGDGRKRRGQALGEGRISELTAPTASSDLRATTRWGGGA